MKIGVSKKEIPVRVPGIGMFGWGVPSNFVEESATPVHARAFLLQTAEETVAIVSCELLCISHAINDAVVDQLGHDHPEIGIERRNLMLLATHTHSAPGGYSAYPFYALEAPGFSPEILADITATIVAAIREAWETRATGEVRFDQSEFEAEARVAFNRSPLSWNRNPETPKITWETRHLGVDRRMKLLRFDTTEGGCIGTINFFGIHGTSVHSDNRKVHFDNKGYAATLLEETRGSGFVGAFAQATTGDISPNFQEHPGKPWTRGMYPDDDASARYSGELQKAKAQEILESAGQQPPLDDQLIARHQYRDLSAIEVDPQFVDGASGKRTAPGKLGMAMFFGTDEGPGLPRKLLFLQSLAQKIRPLWRLMPRSKAARLRQEQHDATHAEKVTVMEMAEHRVLGIRGLRKLPLGKNPDPNLQMIRKMDPHGLADPKPWTPQILPAQLCIVGSVAIAAIPHEMTTTSGKRVEESLLAELEPLGVHDVIIAGYANAYAGYVTTPEEYALQDYEGASTHFGKWTLPGWMTIFADLARDIASETSPTGELSAPRFSAQDLDGRLYEPRTTTHD
jgi:neutral ceramidase